LKWVLTERGWSRGLGPTATRINLSQADISSANLTGVDLAGANLSAANLAFANLSGADLGSANLSSADLGSANLSGASLLTANLSAAYLGRANLSGVDLVLANVSGSMLLGANLSGADLGLANLSSTDLHNADLHGAILRATDLRWSYLVQVNLSGADLMAANLSGAAISTSLRDVNLSAARMDATTALGSVASPVSLDDKTRLLDVTWNGANLASVQWDRTPRLGDEVDIGKDATRMARINTRKAAARAYRGLAKALQAQGLTDPALHYRARQFDLERQALFLERKLGQLVFFWLLDLMSGYGDKPRRALGCYAVVIGTFAGLYWAVTNQVFGFIQSQSTHLKWYEALVLSISSFHGRGFFPSMLSLGDPAKSRVCWK
jgi:uncharacterized protein YjbI with pentapeptide repeats